MNVCRSIVREENRFSQSRSSTQTVAYQNKILFQPNDDHATIELTHLNQLINMVRAKKKNKFYFSSNIDDNRLQYKHTRLLFTYDYIVMLKRYYMLCTQIYI